MIGTKLGANVPFIGKTIKEAASVFSDVHFMPIAIQRKGTQFTMIPRGDTIFEEGILFFSLHSRRLKKFKNYQEKVISL